MKKPPKYATKTKNIQHSGNNNIRRSNWLVYNKSNFSMVTDADLKIMELENIKMFFDTVIDYAMVEEYETCSRNISSLSTNQKDDLLLYLSKLNNNYAIEYCFKKALE